MRRLLHPYARANPYAYIKTVLHAAEGFLVLADAALYLAEPLPLCHRRHHLLSALPGMS